MNQQRGLARRVPALLLVTVASIARVDCAVPPSAPPAVAATSPTSVATPAVTPPGAAAPSAPASGADAKVSNIFAGTDILQALSDIAQAAGVTIIADNTVQGTVTAELKDVPLEQALSILLRAGGYAFAKVDGYYLVGLPDPSNPNYYLLTQTEIVELKHMAPEVVIGMLSNAYGRYLAAEGDAPVPPAGPGMGATSRRAGSPAVTPRLNAMAGASDRGPQRYRIVITAPPDMLDRIKAEIARVDVEPEQVMLEAMVVEVSEEALKEFGIDWATHWMQQDLGSSGATLLYSTVAKTEMVSLRALVDKGRAHLRANPRVATVEGQTAEMEVGKESYYAIVSGPVAYQYATIEQITSGILLRMTPRVIKEDNEIVVRVEPEVRDVTGKGQGGLPEITLRRAATTLRVKDGQSIVIGGLITEQTARSETKIPLLGDLPLVGNLFRHTKTAKARTEVVIVITPHILTGSEVYVDPESTAD